MRLLSHVLSLLAGIAFALAAQAADAPAPDTLTQALELVRQNAAALAPPQARIEVVAGALDARLHLAPCTRVEPFWPPTSRAWGRTRVGLRCVEGPTPWSVYLPVTVKVFAPTLVAAAPLPAGSVLDPGQLRPGAADWATEASPVLEQREALAGRTLARTVAVGQPVHAADLRPRQWFGAGDTVRIDAAGAGFAVSGEGQALSNGFEGQPARVRTAGGRIVSGLPTGERRIEVGL